MLAALGGPSAYGQNAQFADAPCGTSIQHNEVAIEFADPTGLVEAALTIYDRNGTVLLPEIVHGPAAPAYGSGVVLANRAPGQCDVLVGFDGDISLPAVTVLSYGDAAGGVPAPLTLEIRYGIVDKDGNFPHVYRLAYGRLNGSLFTGGGGFFDYPAQGNADFYLLIEEDRIRVSPDDWWRPAPLLSNFIDEVIPDDGWVLPYHVDAYCAVATCPTSQQGALMAPFLMPVTQPLVYGQPYTKQLTPALSMTLRDLGPGYTFDYRWTESWLRLAFAPGTRLDVQADDFRATGMTFTASNIALGWSGIRFLPGSGGGLFGTLQTPTIVERVAGECLDAFCLSMGAGAAIHVEGPSAPVFDGVTVSDPVVGTYVHGLRVTGVSATPLATNLIVDEMTGSGVLALGGATPELRGLGVVLQRNTESAVLSTGTNTNVFLSSVLVGGVLRGPQITLGKAAAVSATSFGTVTFSGPSGGFGFANLETNDGRGLYASSEADIYAGTFASRSRNRIVGNGGALSTGNGFATGTGTTIAARCNWWGSASPASFHIGASSGAVFDAGTFLLGNPYHDANVACTNGNGGEDGLTAGGTTAARSGALAPARGTGNGAGTSSSFGEGDTPADRLSAAYDLPPAEALAVLVALVAEVPEMPESGAALSFAGVLATGDETPPAVAAGALALLTEQAASGALSQAAHGALVGVRLSGGDYAGALASAAALVAQGGAAERTGYAAEVFVRSAAGETAAALSALASLESAWAGSDEALAAREHLTALGVEVPGGGRVAAPETASPDEAEATAETAKTGDAAGPALAVRPNPSAAGAPGAVMLTLAEAANVRVAVYDLLGREVAVVLDGALGAGEHTASLASSALSPGVYVVRAQAAGRVVATARLTVAR